MMRSAGQALADIVVAFAFELEGDAARQHAPNAWPAVP